MTRIELKYSDKLYESLKRRIRIVGHGSVKKYKNLLILTGFEYTIIRNGVKRSDIALTQNNLNTFMKCLSI